MRFLDAVLVYTFALKASVLAVPAPTDHLDTNSSTIRREAPTEWALALFSSQDCDLRTSIFADSGDEPKDCVDIGQQAFSAAFDGGGLFFAQLYTEQECNGFNLALGPGESGSGPRVTRDLQERKHSICRYVGILPHQQVNIPFPVIYWGNADKYIATLITLS
ncbi:hypothetical protein AYL99_01758 [Fonsecaea erecta]|uniref:Ecp2 effector protein domain-containing protein n=1 Tax=Fonsecaea erecta TaxID=1367422 RepID=A0A178ZT00_9EURO|nr:hypothetical protein AYL99_01758 [Fonsecaea erecta]OAP62531.1 hypothetical protein AYL99_01758 [Fonsecaea erecta]